MTVYVPSGQAHFILFRTIIFDEFKFQCTVFYNMLYKLTYDESFIMHYNIYIFLPIA